VDSKIGKNSSSCNNTEEKIDMPKKYTKTFQDNAVHLATQPGNSIAAVALQLKIPVWKLRAWVREAKKELERGPDMDELLRLHNEIKRLKEENEILKKAAAYFAKTL
jgi:transposase